jgi:hypothetical protein
LKDHLAGALKKLRADPYHYGAAELWRARHG